MPAAQSIREIRDAIGGKGRYPPVRSWDCVTLLRLDDDTLLRLDDLARIGVRLRQSATAMAEGLPHGVSRYQLRLFLLCFYPDRWQGLGNAYPSYRQAKYRRHAADPGPAECYIAYVMRTQGLTRRRAIQFIEDPAAAERAA